MQRTSGLAADVIGCEMGGTMRVMTTTLTEMVRLSRLTWEALRDGYRNRMRPWVDARLQRQSRHERHPVHDFLFEYYSFTPAKLLRWSPGVNVILEEARHEELGWTAFQPSGDGLYLPKSAFPTQRQQYVRW